MTARHKPYPVYTSSGVEWLGEIPAHWEVRRIKRVADLNPGKAEARAYHAADTPVTFLPMERVGTEGQIDVREKMATSRVWNGFTYFRRSDVIVAKVTPCFENGKGAFLDSLPTEIGFGSTEFHVLRAKPSVTPQFLYRLTTETAFRQNGTESMTGAAGQQRVPADFVANYQVPLPPIAEQRAIVAFLDRETGKIDALISKKERLIELLQEKRAALISHTVTKGLDPYAPMKDAGVEWLGEIPAYWEVPRLRYVTEMRVSNVDKHTKEDEPPVRLCNYVDVYNNDHITERIVFMPATATIAEIDRFRLEIGDVLITKDSETWDDIGVPALVEHVADDLICGYHLALLRPVKSMLNGGYLLRALQSPVVSYQFHVEAKGVTRFGLTHSSIKSAQLPIPPLAEQIAIAAFLDRETAKLDNLVAKVHNAIELLKELRTAFISAAVTGRIDVREETGCT